MNLQDRVGAFIGLGEDLRKIFNEKLTIGGVGLDDFLNISKSNEWFTVESVEFAIQGWISVLKKENIEKWLSNYSVSDKNNQKKIGVITAGNIPLVGFHDLLCVLISGNELVLKISSKDEKLMKLIIRILIYRNPEFEKLIHLENERLNKFDAIIATGSDNTAKYFEYYFGKYPHIIRKNRNSIAVLDGNETAEELKGLASDIMIYFGLGCRNVSKVFLPKGYDIQKIFKPLYKYKHYNDHNKFANNYTYNKSIYLMNQVPFLENGFIIIKEDSGMSSPISVIYIEYYSDIKKVQERLYLDRNNIQCIVSNISGIDDKVGFGKAQLPELWDYADNVDTMKFLAEL